MDQRIFRKVKAYMERYHMIAPGDTVVAGVSGGADSVCLFLSLWPSPSYHPLPSLCSGQGRNLKYDWLFPMAVLSDGMGSGEKACRDSEFVVDFVEKFLEVGFSKETSSFSKRKTSFIRIPASFIAWDSCFILRSPICIKRQDSSATCVGLG